MKHLLPKKQLLFNCKDKKRGIIPKGVIYIGRGSKWGNPFVIGKDGSREEVVEKYDKYLRQLLKENKITIEELAELYNKSLLCHCYPLLCHGNVLIIASQWAYQKLGNNMLKSKYLSSKNKYPNGMNKEDFINEYKKFISETGLNIKDCPVGAGGSCLLMGIRKTTNDIDMAVPDEFFHMCKKSGKYEVKTFTAKPGVPAVEVISYNHFIDMHLPDNKETIIIDGVCTWTPKEVYDFKMKMNRPKDQEDIIGLRKKYGFK